MTAIFHEVKRVLKKEGTLFLNMGDTYGGSCQGGGDTGLSKHRYRKELLTYIDKPQRKIMPKCLLMVPERLAWSLIQDGWILRNKISWIKPNCMPSSVKDRFSNKWEYIFYFVKSQRNYFNLDAVREPYVNSTIQRVMQNEGNPRWDGNRKRGHPKGQDTLNPKQFTHPKGKNPGDVWVINTRPCPIKGVHFATFPPELCEKAILPGCQENGIVLDPFCGAGTALYVAKEMRRRYIGIDIKQEYVDMSKKRLAQGVL